MLIGAVSSSDVRATSSSSGSGSANSQQPQVTPADQRNWNNYAGFISEFAFQPADGTTMRSAAPTSTFALNPSPAYDPSIPSNLDSNDGRVAANSLLGLEQFGAGSVQPQMEAQIVASTLGQHKNDPEFLQQYLGALGANRTASILSYIASPGNVQTPVNYTSGAATPEQVKQQYQNVADALSTLVNNDDFSQSDMDQLVGQFAKGNPQVNFFAKHVLSSASPQVNQMFFQSAKNYALQNSRSSAGQAIAAYAMQALAQAPKPLQTLQALPDAQLSTLVSAAMKGEAAYGNPPTVEDFSKTGVFRDANGQGDPLNGLTKLMFDAAYADVGDHFAPAALSTSQAQDLQSRLFQTAIGTLQNNSSVKSFYNQSAPMKDALAVDFQQGYNAIVKAYSGPDGELNSAGMSAFREFFADAVFSTPPSSYALGAVQTIQNRLANYIAEADKMGSNAQPSQQEIANAESLGEQAQAVAAGLKESFASILNGSAKADQNTKDLVGALLSVGAAGVGVAGPEASVGAAIVGEALTLLVNSGSGSGASDVQAAVRELASHGINVNGYNPGAFYDLSTKMANANFRMPLQLGLDTGATVLYNG
jgi:hypothetical protein